MILLNFEKHRNKERNIKTFNKQKLIRRAKLTFYYLIYFVAKEVKKKKSLNISIVHFILIYSFKISGEY